MAPRDLAATWRAVRARSLALCEGLATEDLVVQSMPDASPLRWHLAHTTWFFETFVRRPFGAPFTPRDARFEHLFNSYYEGVGAAFPRALRGTQSRPTVAEIIDWRHEVDAAMLALLADPEPEVARVLTIGLHHEQQHQELMITDLKHALCTSPMAPAVWPAAATPATAPTDGWLAVPAGFGTSGHPGDGFCFDNERPAHPVWTPGFTLARALVTNADWLAFMADGGYAQVGLWMSDGWAARALGDWQAPLYWARRDGAWFEATLAGERPVAPHAPVCHVSWFEADAYARWAGARLPTEFEWDRGVAAVEGAPGAASASAHQPDGAADAGPLAHLFGQVWQWTGSAYRPYPGYQPLPGALGEYNGKFMHGQLVLRGASCATPPGHARGSYRNFFPAHTRWQFSGVRLARDL